MAGNLNVEALSDIINELGTEGDRIKNVMDSVNAQDRSKFSPTQALEALQPLIEKLGGLGKLSELSAKLNKMADSYKDLSPQDKLEFDQKAKSQIADKLEKVKQLTESLGGGNILGASSESDSSALDQYGTGTILLCILLVLAVFAFFGYKLYKSLKDREVKREEKKKQKQLRKKK